MPTKKVSKLSNKFISQLFKQNSIAQERQLRKAINRYYSNKAKVVKENEAVDQLKSIV